MTLFVVLAGWIFVGSARASDADRAPVVAVSGRVLGASNAHVVYVMLWDAGGFLKKPVQKLELKPGAERSFSFSAAPGRWAISAFEDVNGNGILDIGAFGPKEPSGFWRPFKAWRKPRFDDVASQIDRDVADANVALR